MRSKELKKILSVITYIVFIVIIIGIIFFLSNYKVYIVATGSMQPTFNINEMIIVKKSNINTIYSVGDIITYYDSNIDIDVTHRIVEIDEDDIYTQGDYNNARDLNPIHKDSIVGKVVYNSYFLGYLYTNYKYYILVLTVLLIIAINIF